MYSLYAPMLDEYATLRKLLKEVLGYTDSEVDILESESFGRNIANNLTIEQAKNITKIFNDNDFPLYLKDGYNSTVYWNQLGIDWVDEPPRDHYCDEPLIAREHLADLSIPKKVDPPIKEILGSTSQKITCPYCKSTNTKKIGILGRSISFELFGFGSSKVGKQWHCNNCNSDF